MTSALLTDLLESLALLGVFLLIGTLLRAKIRLFQSLFLPANVIGGFLLLILGPQVLNILPVPEGWFANYNLIPGILIVPIVTAVPLGLRFSAGSGKAGSDFMKNAFPLFGIMLGVAALQYAAGYGVQAVFKDAFGLYDVFGAELAIGFVGGHGSAGTLGNLLTELKLDYALTSQGVATTTATFGIVGGIVAGIALINWASRKGLTAVMSKPSDIPSNMRAGYEPDVSRQGSCGRETTLSCSIDTYAFHLTLIFAACGIAYLCAKYLKTVPVLGSFSVWAYGMIAMALIWIAMCRLKLDSLVDSKVRSHITGTMTDFAVIAAIASLPLKAVAVYIVPILILIAAGFICTAAFMLILSRRCLKGCWFEQMIASFGMATGVFITGVLLLRIVDPDGETPALSTYSLSYTLMSCVFFALMGQLIKAPVTCGAAAAAGICLALTALCVIFTLVSARLLFGKKTRDGK